MIAIFADSPDRVIELHSKRGHLMNAAIIVHDLDTGHKYPTLYIVMYEYNIGGLKRKFSDNPMDLTKNPDEWKTAYIVRDSHLEAWEEYKRIQTVKGVCQYRCLKAPRLYVPWNPSGRDLM